MSRRPAGLPLLVPALALAAVAALAALLLAPPARAAPGLENPGLLEDHAPIRIDGDLGFDAAHGVRGGSGTLDDPYLLAHWRIASPGVQVRIANTTKPFILRNLELRGTCEADPATNTTCPGEAGVYVQNGTSPFLAHLLVTDMDRAGILLYNVSDPEVVESVVQRGGTAVSPGNAGSGTGIELTGCRNAVVRGNEVLDIGPDLATAGGVSSAGIKVWLSLGTQVADNVVRNATESGINLLFDRGTEVVDNDIVRNHVGIAAQTPFGALVHFNNLTENDATGVLVAVPLGYATSQVFLERNTIAYNRLIGVHALDGSNVTGAGNNLVQNGQAGLQLDGRATADLAGSWWNAADGPSGPAGGHGDRISLFQANLSQVRFRPFLASPAAPAGAHAPREAATVIAGPAAPPPPPRPGEAPDPTPVAVFEGPSQAAVAAPVEFSAVRAYDPDGGTLRYRWDLGDGALASGLRVVHAYDATGNYTVRLTVTDPTNLTSTSSTLLRVARQPLGVQLVASDLTVPRGHALLLRAVPLGQPLGNVSYRWTTSGPDAFGGPTEDDVLVANMSEPGERIVGVEATAPGDPPARAFLTVQVVNRPPVARAEVEPAEGDTRTTFTFRAAASSDPDNDTLAFTWDWGAGQQTPGPEAQHRFPSPGPAVVLLTASDGYASSTTQVVVQVAAAKQGGGGNGAPGFEAPLLALAAALALALRRRVR
jgi:hypothetical protein